MYCAFSKIKNNPRSLKKLIYSHLYKTNTTKVVPLCPLYLIDSLFAECAAANSVINDEDVLNL